MRVFLLFMLSVFVAAGTRLGPRLDRRPILLIAFAFVVAASFYTLRVIR